MLHIIQKACQYANPYVIEALTHVNGVYVDVYDKLESDTYDEGRDTYISNVLKFNKTPTYSKIKLLLNRPVQLVFGSGEDSFDNYMEDLYFITCNKSLVFKKKQKFDIFYDKKDSIPQRTMQCFEVREYSNSYNQWSTRHIVLQPFN